MNQTRLITLIVLLAAAAALSTTAQEDTPDVEEIVNKANEASYYAGQDGRADVAMTITDDKGNTRTRSFTILRLDTDGGDQKFYVYFKEPADVRKMAYLVWKHADKDDDRWLWLPSLNLNKRIAPGDKRTSFVGSDFLYEDISGRALDEDTHELTETTDTHYVVKNVPKDPGSVEFSYFEIHINRETNLPDRGEFFDKQGKLYRELEAVKVENVDGHHTATVMAARDIARGSATTNVFTNIKYDIGLKERIFTERFLRRPPREVTKR